MATDWIEGPALETLMALGGIQPGDELKIDRCTYDVHSDTPFLRAGVVTVKEYTYTDDGEPRWFCVSPGVATGSMIVVPENIVGWRRP